MENLAGIDQIDQRILSALDANSRASVADLARNLKLGRDRVTYRMKQLEDSGVIFRYTTIINPYKLGLTAYKTYLKIQNERSRLTKVVAYLKDHPQVYWVGETEGKWDLIFVIFARNPKELHSLQDDILSEFSDIVLEFSVYTLVDVIFYPKRYLAGSGNVQYFFGGRPENHKVDEVDLQIMRLLSENSRTPIKDLAAQVGVTPIIAKYRIQKLENLGIIIAHRIDIDLDKLGMSFFKLEINQQSYKRGAERELIEYCANNPAIVNFIQQIGQCKIELEIAVASYDQSSQITTEIRQRFPKLVRSIDTLLIRRQHYKWMPFAILSQGALKPRSRRKSRTAPGRAPVVTAASR